MQTHSIPATSAAGFRDAPGIVPELLTTAEAARLAGVGERTWWRWSRSGLGFADAPCQRTPRGRRHFIFRKPAGANIRNSVSTIAPNVEVRTDGDFIVVAPSVTGDGRYEWLRLLDCRPENLPDLPLSILRLIGPTGLNRQQPQAGEAGGKPKSQASQLVELASVIELWHTAGQDAPYATIPVSGHREHWPIRSSTFRQWLCRQFFDRHSTTPSSHAIQDAISVIEGKAVFDGPERALFIRVADHGGRLYLDLSNDAWQAVEIDDDGWRIVPSEACPVRFRRAKAMMPLPTPQSGGTIEQLRRFVNITAQDWPLLLGWIVAAFRPTGP